MGFGGDGVRDTHAHWGLCRPPHGCRSLQWAVGIWLQTSLELCTFVAITVCYTSMGLKAAFVAVSERENIEVGSSRFADRHKVTRALLKEAMGFDRFSTIN